VYGILQQSGGRITVDSAPGVGSTFRAYLPVATGSALRAVRGTPAPARVPSAPEAVDGIVLVADDNSQVRKVTRTLLERRGYSVLEAENGAEALSLLSDPSRRVDLLVSDVVMPVMGGLQLVQRLNELRIDTRVLLVSGFTADAVIDRGSLPAGIAFLEKPFSEQALLASVSELLTSAPRAGRRRDIGADPDARPMIVVVDDTELNRVLVSMLLEDRYRVHTHAGGRSAIGMLGELEPRPELLLLDIDMPEVDGFELLESIRAHPGLAGCRVVAFTASASSEARNAYARAGFDAFLAKPIADPVAFLERIDEEVRLATLPTS
jgi:CheY-like chemotaxis protein